MRRAEDSLPRATNRAADPRRPLPPALLIRRANKSLDMTDSPRRREAQTYANELPAGQAIAQRNRISWGAVVAGAVVALATTLVFTLLGVAAGVASLRPLDPGSGSVASYGIGAAIWQGANLALSMALGGYVAARLSGSASRVEGSLHALTMWAVAVLLGSVLLAQAVSGLVSLVGQGARAAAGLFAGGASAVSALPGGSAADAVKIADRLQGVLGAGAKAAGAGVGQAGAGLASVAGASLLDGVLSEQDRERLLATVASQYGVTREEAAARLEKLQRDLASGAYASAARDQASAQIKAILDGSLLTGVVSEADRERLVALVTEQYGVARDEAARRVAQVEKEARATLAQVEQKAREAADATARATAAATGGLFAAFIVGLGAALVGAWLATRRERGARRFRRAAEGE